jgi:hypothetical protein
MNPFKRSGYMAIGDWLWSLFGLGLILWEEGPDALAHPWIVIIGVALVLWQWLGAIRTASVRVDDIATPGSGFDVHVNRHRDVEEWLRWARDAYVRGDFEIDELERSVEHVLHGRGPLGDAASDPGHLNGADQ